LATLDAGAPMMDWVFGEEALCTGSTPPRPLASGAERLCGMTASGAGEPNEGEGEP